MRVGGLLYASRKFGGGLRAETPLQPGEDFSFTDDSGTRGVITPGVNMRNPNFDGVTDTNPFISPGTLTVRTFATDDNEKGGVILVNVDVDNPEAPGFSGNHGVIVKS